MLKNNSPEMKTVVETFLIEETVALIYDNEQLEKWNKYVEDLGLTGQMAVVKKENIPVPFMHMPAQLTAIAETLCPMKVAVEAYNLTPIPVEILELVALSKKEGYFEKIQIWYDDKARDPFCIGLRYATEEHKASAYSWNLQPYLIGKWADVKHSWEKLRERAVKRWKANEKNELEKRIKDATRALEDLDNTAFTKFSSGAVSGDDNLPF